MTTFSAKLNEQIEEKKQEVIDFINEGHEAEINGLVPTIVTCRINPRKTRVFFRFHAPGSVGAVKLDHLPDGNILTQWVDNAWT